MWKEAWPSAIILSYISFLFIIFSVNIYGPGIVLGDSDALDCLCEAWSCSEDKPLLL